MSLAAQSAHSAVKGHGPFMSMASHGTRQRWYPRHQHRNRLTKSGIRPTVVLSESIILVIQDPPGSGLPAGPRQRTHYLFAIISKPGSPGPAALAVAARLLRRPLAGLAPEPTWRSGGLPDSYITVTSIRPVGVKV